MYFNYKIFKGRKNESPLRTLLVARTGIEPVRPNSHSILSATCLPVPSSRQP